MKLLFVLPFQTTEEIALLKSVGAVTKEGAIKPIAGEFLKIITGGKMNIIFCKGPNGILLRAFEERPVKLAVSKKKTINPSKKDERSELGKNDECNHWYPL